jgi:peptidoglycan/LPS O-acetylase OafA/YrhL
MSTQVQNVPNLIEAPQIPVRAADDTLPSSPPRLHLPFLDGIRGLAALYVCLFHVREESLKQMSGTLAAITAPLHYGHEAVCLFIVLSGFCLMLPFVNKKPGSSASSNSWPSIQQFIQRRAQRIFPGYYAALIFSILLNVFSIQVIRAVAKGNFSGLDMASLFPDLTVSNVAYHTFLLHNLLNGSSHFQNYPLWSIAMEWQIYFFFILLLLPLWQKIGIGGTILTALVISLIPHYLFPVAYNLDWTYPWMLVLFALGMAAAQIGLTPLYQTKQWNTPNNWFLVSIISTVSAIALIRGSEVMNRPHWFWISDIFMGIAAASLILYSTQRTLQGTKESKVVRFLESKGPLFLGAMSYSLYLTHKLFLMKLGAFVVPVMNRLPFSQDGKVIFFFVVSVPLAVALSYLFYRVFEKPFLPKAGKAKTSR